MADTAARDPAIAGILKRPFAEQVAFFRAKLARLVPTARWTDMLRAAHDKGFMVAGAQSADLLADLAAAVSRAVVEGVGIDAFRRDFAAAVAKAGWSYTGDFNWRTRTIYRTNIATSYAAGRLAQLRAGGFAWYLYKHGDSLVPRPQHLAWDGLVLPSTHEFWQAHYPPSAWGCSCRVVGLRDPEDARSLGGDPAKPLPRDWDTIDPKTGAPVGVGKGWDYVPGDTVSDTVAQMAAKTQQWDYVLAKAYMQGVPDGVRDRLAQAYRALTSVANDTRLYAQKILEGRTNLDIPPYRTLGLATRDQVMRINAAIDADVTAFDFSLDQYAPLHIFKEHGDPKVETSRGQRAVVAGDYARLPQIINDADRMSFDGGEVLMEKTFGEERQVAVFAPLGKRRTLVLKSMRIYRKAPPRSTAWPFGV